MTQGAAPHDWLVNTGSSSGIGVPLAIGASMAAPGRPVFCLEGDGSFMYTLQALWTAARAVITNPSEPVAGQVMDEKASAKVAIRDELCWRRKCSRFPWVRSRSPMPVADPADRRTLPGTLVS